MPKRIVNVGICTVDAIGQHVDEYPERRGLIQFDRLTLTTGGNAVNCSIALRKLGVDCQAVVKVGGDVLGDFVRGELERHGVGTAGLIRGDDEGTPFTFVCAHRDGERSFIHTPGTNATLRLEEIDLALVESADVVFLTGSMIMARLDGVPSGELLRRARAAGCVTVLDTVYADTAPRERWEQVVYPCLPHLDYFVPSLPEAMALSGLTDVSAMADDFRRRGCKNVVIKLDAAGAYCLSGAGQRHRVGAYRVEKPVDATGAGDTWCAGFLAGLADGLDLLDCVRLGHAVAAHCIQHTGASAGIPTLDEIRRFQATTPGGDAVPV
ncbi:MAG: carbohydrate kinase family protein [bacterium]|nr:carbohydrate kinase family protein [bacterium]